MDSALNSLNTVRDWECRQRDAARQALREAEQRLAQLLAQGQALQQYRRDIEARWIAPLEQAMQMPLWNTARGFAGRLDQALLQQAPGEQQARAHTEQRRRELMAAETRVAMMDKLIERRRADLNAQAQRREQLQNDEWAQRARSAWQENLQPQTEEPLT